MAASQIAPVRLKGIPELRAALRSLGPEYRRAFDSEIRKAGAPIVRKSRFAYRRLHRPSHRRRNSHRGIRSSYRGGKLRVILDGAKYPWLPSQEWGGYAARWPKVNPEGYFFWGSVMNGIDDVQREVGKAVERANRRAFPGRFGGE